MALALYRKYRPRTFAEIIGQEHVTEPLSQALRTGRLHHAYLFSGPRGCGKTSSARILARSLNCEKGPTPDPCGECDSCRALAPDGPGSIDVIEIDAASHGGVDDARDLRERAFFAPVSSRYKVYVIDEAHMVSSAGFNALLKLVEEPPDYVKFVFATTEPEKVLGTIKSRTHHYPFRLIPPGVMRPYLEQLCDAEGAKVEPNVFPLVVRAGGGSGRDSLSILDQLIAGAGDEGVTYARAVALLGVTDVTLIDEVCDAVAAGDGAAVFSTIDRVAEAGHDPRRFAGDLLARLRDLIVMQQVPDAVSKGLLDGADDELSRMEAQAQRFGPATLSRMADVVHTGLTDMRGTTSPRLVLELIAARMLLPGAEDSTGALLQRLERMERRITSGDANVTSPSLEHAATTERSLSPDRSPSPERSPSPPRRTEQPPARPSATPTPSSRPPAQPPAAPAAAAPRDVVERETAPRDTAPSDTAPLEVAQPPADVHPAASTPASGAKPKPVGALDAADIRRQWDLVLTQVRRANMRVWAIVREAVVREVEGDTLVLVFQHQFHAQALSSDPKLVVEALTEVFGGKWQIRCELSGHREVSEQPGAGSAAATPVESRTAGSDDWPATAPVNRDDPGRADSDGGWPVAARPPSSEAAPARPKAKTRAAARPEAAPEPEIGFDIGDEPLDDGDEPDAVRQSSEEQAIDLLRQTLGAEKIGDLDSR